jgi:hypothetical protein
MLTLLCGLSAAAGAAPPCTGTPLALGGVSYPQPLDAGATAFFTVAVPAPGWLAVEIAVPGFESDLPWVEVLAERCAAGEATGAVHRQRTLRRQVLAIEAPGVYPLRVAAFDPRAVVDSYALSAQFSPLPAPKNGGEPGGGGDGDNEESNNEIVPIVVGDPASVTGSGSSVDMFAVACRKHGGLRLCARELAFGDSVAGELGGGSEGQYFTFTLDRARAVRIESGGETDTLGILYDGAGQRLLMADDGGLGESFAIAAHLPPGRYFVRVEGATGAAGSFQLRLSGRDL